MFGSRPGPLPLIVSVYLESSGRVERHVKRQAKGLLLGLVRGFVQQRKLRLILSVANVYTQTSGFLIRTSFVFISKNSFMLHKYSVAASRWYEAAEGRDDIG